MTARAQVDQRPDRLIATFDDAVLFEYVYRPNLPAVLAPRPYFHPLRTLRGILLTGHQPADHRWHLGLAYSWPVVDGWNLWGGPTYQRDRGYVELANHGEIRHLGWSGLSERLVWLDGDGVELAEERREIGTPVVDRAAGAWWLELSCQIENVSGRPLRLGSPTTEGRPLAGYAGLAWRGTEDLRGASVLLDGNPAGDAAMGARARWLGCVGGGVSVGVLQDLADGADPNKWFVRTAEYLLVTSSPVFDQVLELGPAGKIELRHRLVLADGVRTPEALAELLGVRRAGGHAAVEPPPNLEPPARPAGAPSGAAGPAR